MALDKAQLERLVELREEGWSWSKLAVEFGLHDRQAARREWMKVKGGNVTTPKAPQIPKELRLMRKVLQTAEKPGESLELMNMRCYFRDHEPRFRAEYRKAEAEWRAISKPHEQVTAHLDQGSERCIKVLEDWLQKKEWKG